MPRGKKENGEGKSNTIEITLGAKADSSKSDKKEDKKPIKRKRLGTNQLVELEAEFKLDIYPSTQKKEELATRLNLDPNTVSKWFINRRVKLRNEGPSDKEQPTVMKTQVAEEQSAKDAPFLTLTIGPSQTAKVEVQPTKSQTVTSTSATSSVPSESAPSPVKEAATVPTVKEPTSKSTTRETTTAIVTTTPLSNTIVLKSKKAKSSQVYSRDEEAEFWNNYKKSNLPQADSEEPDSKGYVNKLMILLMLR